VEEPPPLVSESMSVVANLLGSCADETTGLDWQE